MASFRDNPEAIEQRRQRLAQVSVERSGPAGDIEPAGPDPFRGRKANREACDILTDRIVPDPNQPRTEFEPDALERLAKSVKARGVLQPIRVRWDATGDRYVIVTGERRWRAAIAAGMPAIPCVVAPDATADEILEDQLVENCLREDLRPVEQARAFKSMMGRLGLSQRDLATRLNLSQSGVMQALRLLELPEPIQIQVDSGAIAPSTGYQIARVTDPEEQAALAVAAASGSLKRDELAGRTRKASEKGRGDRPKPWTHTQAGRIKITATPLADDVTDDEITEALKAAVAARRKRSRGERAA